MIRFFALLQELLKRPFPLPGDSLPSFLRTALSFGVFVTLFLSLFTPIGLDAVPAPMLYVHTLVYGALCSVIMLGNSLLLPRAFPRAFESESWNVGKHIGFSLWTVLTVALGNVGYSVWQFHFQMSLSTVITFLGITLLIGLFPATVLTLLQERRLLRRNIDSASRISAHLHNPDVNDVAPPQGGNASNDTSSQTPSSTAAVSPNLVFEGASAKERLETPPEAIICLQSSDNYVTVVELNDGELRTTMLRMTLKSAEERTNNYPHIMRCHKSYMVNLKFVRDISGNAQGYKLHIPALNFPVPVSRSYQDRVLQALER
jgi:hypothetical protein